jgi:hypothetical protein
MTGVPHRMLLVVSDYILVIQKTTTAEVSTKGCPAFSFVHLFSCSKSATSVKVPGHG